MQASFILGPPGVANLDGILTGKIDALRQGEEPSGSFTLYLFLFSKQECLGALAEFLLI